jgi:DNA polymerase V
MIFKKGYAYKKAGVIVQDFTPDKNTQIKLFENRDLRHLPLMEAIDKVNAMYGYQKIRLASQDQKRIWKMKQERLSPKYSTQLSDIITIHV